MSGKTTTTVKLISNLRALRKWTRIILMCPTAFQKTYDPIRRYISKVINEPSPPRLKGVLREAMRTQRAGGRTLLIIDDCADQPILNTAYKGSLPNLINNARHYALSLIIITQNITSVTPSMRQNAECVLFFPTIKDGELECFLRERNPSWLQKGQLQDMTFDAHTRGPHSFLFQIIDAEGSRHLSGFDQVYTPRPDGSVGRSNLLGAPLHSDLKSTNTPGPSYNARRVLGATDRDDSDPDRRQRRFQPNSYSTRRRLEPGQ